MKKLTKEEFVNREPDLLNGEYEFIGKYENTDTKTLFRHSTCGYEYTVTPYHFHRGRRCPKCAGCIRYTKKSFCEREEDILSGEYEFVGEYINTRTKTLFRHNSCGYEWKIRPGSFHMGVRCPQCAGCIKLTKERFCNRESDIKSGEYKMLGEFVNTSTKILFKHSRCGYKYKATPSDFHQGYRCPKCAGNMIKTTEEFINENADLRSGEYLMLGEYVRSAIKVSFQHVKCGNIWHQTPNDFQSGKRCPKCNQSKGEKAINKLLENLDVEFESQKRFNTCKYKKPLPFDFYVDDSFLIEYDGEQHFRTKSVFGGDEEFKLRQLRDSIKTQWAKDNGIPLVRIPYTQFDNIEQIIKDSVDKYCGKSDGSKIIV